MCFWWWKTNNANPSADTQRYSIVLFPPHPLWRQNISYKRVGELKDEFHVCFVIIVKPSAGCRCEICRDVPGMLSKMASHQIVQHATANSSNRNPELATEGRMLSELKETTWSLPAMGSQSTSQPSSQS